MQIVIDIPEEIYSRVELMDNEKMLPYNLRKAYLLIIICAITNGKILPKGHGRLKDTDAICKDIISALGIRDENYLLEAEEAIYKRIKNAPTIIEADKESYEA